MSVNELIKGLIEAGMEESNLEDIKESTHYYGRNRWTSYGSKWQVV